MASAVILSQGTEVAISTAAVTDVTASPDPTFELIDCIGKDIQVQGGTSPEIDVTTICSTAKEFRLGLQDAGSMTINGHWVQGHPAHGVIRTAAADKQTRLIQITFSDGSTYRVLALVQQRSFNFGIDGVVSGTFTFRLTGEAIETDVAVV